MLYFRYSIKVLLLSLIFSIIFLNATQIAAFSDDFTSDPRTNPKWDVQNSSGLVFDNPGITLTSSSSSFPYMKSSAINDLSANKYHEITFQYLSSSSSWGVGASFTDNAPNYPTYFGPIEDYLKYNIAYFFGNNLHSVTTLCPVGSSSCPNTWWFIYPNSPPTNLYQGSTPKDFNIHTFSVVRTDIFPDHYSYKVYLDGTLLTETQPSTRLINAIWIGHPSDLGTPKDWPILRILSVNSSPEAPVSFPYLSQKDPLWGSKEYDTASAWAGVEKSGIERWGCALTSAAMILQNYDVQTATGSAVTPDGLNDWLKAEPDGYIGPGYVNWLAITRYALESYESEHASTKLEFVRTYPPSTPELPAILGVPGHFVVAHGEDATNWNINDPASETAQTLAKTATITSINKFVPSLTDLSYMLFAIDSDVTATLTNESGETVQDSWIDEFLSDDTELATGAAIRTLMIPKPSSGKYKLTVNRPVDTERLVKIYLYDQLGNTAPQVLPISLPTTYFEIQYGSEEGDMRSAIEVDRTPPSVPVLLSPGEGKHVSTAGLILDWSDVTDPSTPVRYNYQSSWGGGGHYGPVSTGTNSFINAPGTPDNTYNWQVQACDNADNCSEWASREVIVDSTAPTVDLVFPTPGPSSNYFEAVFNELVDPVEATNGANYYLSNWPGAGGSGDLVGDANITYNPENKTARIIFTNPGWYISAEQLWGVQNIADLAGNMLSVNPYSEYSTAMLAPVLTAPPTTTSNPVATLTQTWSWLTGSDGGSGIAGYHSRIFDNILGSYVADWRSLGNVLSASTSLGEGKWKLSLQASDRAGNRSEILDSSELVVDTTSPSVPVNLHFDNPSIECGGFTNSKMITIDWDDASDNTAVYGYEYNIDYPLASGTGRGSWTTTFLTSSYRGSLNEGIHYIKIRTKDTAGNYSAWSNSCAITYDSQIPTFDSQTTFADWYTDPQTSYFDYTDPNMQSDYLAPSCETNSEGTTQTCQITPNVCDKAGNCNTTTRTSNQAMIDFTKPVVGLDVWGQTLSGTASDTLSQIDKVEIRLTKPGESEATVGATGTTNWSYMIDPAPIGHYKAIVVAFDNAGNTSDEVVKEYDINPSSGSSTASSTPTPTSTPSPSGLVAGASTQKLVEKDDEVLESESPSPSISPSPDAEVLGETTESEPNSNYWWLLLTIPAMSLVLYLVARSR